MIRKFNYTNRKNIPREDIFITIHKSDGKFSFSLRLDCTNLSFPADAKVYIEAYYGPNYLRFDYGKFENIQEPFNTDISDLKNFSEKLFFRIKIVDETSENGLLLGFADKIPLSDDSEKKGTQSILFVNPVLMNTKEIWRINFDDELTGPILEVNNAIEGIKDIAKSDKLFISLVYPSAIRQILNKISELNSFSADGDEWSNKWINFTENTLNVKNTPENNDDNDGVSIWKDNAVKAFCIKFRIFEQFLKQFEL